MKKRILIAEDDLETREILFSLLTKHGYDVTEVADGVQLLAISVEETFDLIITDLMMANLNGASAARIINMQENAVPVIALTALSSSETLLVQDCFSKIFHKPCDLRVLLEYINHLIVK